MRVVIAVIAVIARALWPWRAWAVAKRLWSRRAADLRAHGSAANGVPHLLRATCPVRITAPANRNLSIRPMNRHFLAGVRSRILGAPFCDPTIASVAAPTVNFVVG
jgi:hypothetical protein